MENSQESVEKKVEKVKSLFKDKYQVAIIAIVVFALAIRLYYLYQTAGQTLWWDEAEYGSMAKHFFFDLPYKLNNERPFLFPWILGLLFKIGASEMIAKFVLVVIPSTALVYFIYLLGTEMFSRRVGIISAFFAAVSWTFLFWSVRLQPDSLSMCFQVLAILFMWRYWKSDKNSLALYAGIFASLGFNFKVSGMLVPMIFLVFIIIKDRTSMFKKKGYWLFAAAFLVTLLPQFIYSYYSFGSPTSLLFNTGYVGEVLKDKPLDWANIKFVYALSENLMFIFFLVGWILALRFIVYLDIILKDKNKALNAEMFSAITIVLVSAFYIFYIRGTEDRWVFLWMPFIFFLASNGIEYIGKIFHKYNKTTTWVVIGIIIFAIGYLQVSHADELIKAKEESYGPVRDAGLWLKENSAKDAKVLSISLTQTPYYSERNVTTYAWIKNSSQFNDFLNNTDPDYLQVSVFERHPEWINEWLANNQNRLNPVDAYFSDPQKQQAVLILYEFK